MKKYAIFFLLKHRQSTDDPKQCSPCVYI